jgi:hypothetical protein
MKSRLDIADTVPGRRGGANALIFRQIRQAAGYVASAFMKLQFQI